MQAITPLSTPTPLRAAITAGTRTPEPDLLPALLAAATLDPHQAQAAQALALRIAGGVRARARASGRAGLVQGLLQEFALSSQEGVALMCLAEALLRIPDAATRDALIRDKIGDGDWQSHLGQSKSLFVNAASWGLLLTGKLVSTHSDSRLSNTLRQVVARGGEPLIRRGVDMAMRMMGEQFVTGETITQALANARPREAQGFRYSYDMLGEAAMTEADARRYQAAYAQAIDAIGAAAAGRGVIEGPGISIKLSALHPRYARAKIERVMQELYPRLLALAQQACGLDIGMNIDAEEADRLEISLDLLERLAFEPSLRGWHGLGFVIQAYQKRCPAVVDHVVDLARRSGHRLMIRLVKGAYWDSEIKRAQLDGQSGYPVYTRKPYTDVAYIVCARKLLAATDAVFAQFATHNAQTLASICAIAGDDFQAGQYEFQCLHGMGEPLYEQVVGPVEKGKLGRPCRIYAPVGEHDTLLAYLVRRLLENGANSSFVNRIADENVPLEVLAQDPVATVRAMAQQDGSIGLPHPAIPLPRELYGTVRVNSAGIDLADETTLSRLDQVFAEDATRRWDAAPLLAIEPAAAAVASSANRPATSLAISPATAFATAPATSEAIAPTTEGASDRAGGETLPIHNPANADDVVGWVREATQADVALALAAAAEAAGAWALQPPAARAAMLDAGADRLEADLPVLFPLLVREAGKTAANAVSEVREAVDFLRYYASEVRRDFDNTTHKPLGPVVCISPWNFPLAIFTGQVAAALAAGNVVLAKPAEQTPLVAAHAVRALHAAGVPRGALQLLPGRGETVGAALVGDARVHGVLFTGSTEVARLLQRELAGRLTADGQVVPLIAETGGQNALVVDSSALTEQAVADIVSSAFDSCGQRCSALRLLCVQEDGADRLLGMLRGAVQELAVGDPRSLATDVGPVIDADALSLVEQHVAAMQARGCRVWRLPLQTDAAAQQHGHFVAPTVIEIDRVADLGREVFGPVLHVLRYRRDRLDDVLDAINGTGYGLTQGVHTRIDETVAQVVSAARAGNIYVNRNVVGAVVGVQPFGGEGLSGTGPKAGGPLYLLRLLTQRPVQAARIAVAHAGALTRPAVRGLSTEPAPGPASAPLALAQLRSWAQAQGMNPLAAYCDRAVAESPLGRWHGLQGPTGEANLYAVIPREAVLCLTQEHIQPSLGQAPRGDARKPGSGPAFFHEASAGDADRLLQLAAVLAAGSHAIWPASAAALRERLPADVRERITLTGDWSNAHTMFDAVLHHGDAATRQAVARTLAARPGPIVGLTGLAPGDTRIPLERLVLERSLSINTAAAGGNASLMTLD